MFFPVMMFAGYSGPLLLNDGYTHARASDIYLRDRIHAAKGNASAESGKRYAGMYVNTLCRGWGCMVHTYRMNSSNGTRTAPQKVSCSTSYP